VYDKAEAAATLENEQTQLLNLTASLNEKNKELKNSTDPHVQQQLEKEINLQEKEIEILSQNLAQRNEIEND